MKVTKKLIEKIKQAEKKGYAKIVVTRGGKYGNTAVATWDFAHVRNCLGQHLTARRGIWLSKNFNPYRDGGISYLALFQLEEEV